MTIEQKFNQILSILPDDGSRILVEGAKLCMDNDWLEHTLKDMYKSWNGYRHVIRYHTESNIQGSINIYDFYEPEEYEADTECLYNWLTVNGYFGRFDRNLFSL